MVGKFFSIFAVIAAALSSQCSAAPVGTLTIDASIYGMAGPASYDVVIDSAFGATSSLPDHPALSSSSIVGGGFGPSWNTEDGPYELGFAFLHSGEVIDLGRFPLSPHFGIDVNAAGPWSWSGSFEDGSFSTDLSGFQSFQVPEPATMAAVMGASLLLSRRCRRSAAR